jgi:hypothetical protein
VSSTEASNYLKFSLHNGTENTVVDVLTLNGNKNATFAGDIILGANHIGRDSHNIIDFATDNHITFKTDQSTALQIDSNQSVKIIAGSLQISGDNANFATLTESGSGDFTIAAVDDIRLDSGGGDVVLKAGGTEYGRLSNSSADFVIQNTTSDKDIIFKGVDDATTITALTLDMSDGGWATFNSGIHVANTFSPSTFGKATFAGNVTLNTGTAKKLSILASTHDTNTAQTATLELGYTHSGGAAAGNIVLTEAANNAFDADMTFGLPYNNGSGGSTTRTALTLDGGTLAATFAGNVKIQKNTPILELGTSNVSTGNSKITFFSKNNNAANAYSLQFNKDTGIDRLEFIDGSGNANIKFNNGGSATFAGGIDTTDVNIKVGSAIHGTITSSSNSLTLNARNTGKLIFQSGGVEKMRINGTNVGIGEDSPNAKLEVTGDIEDNWAGRFENTNTGGYGILAKIAGTSADERIFEARVGSSTKMLISGDGNTTFAGNITANTGASHSFLTGNTNNLSTADLHGFRLHQTSYTDGKYTHRFRKRDMSGGVPLYLDFSSGTANVFSNLMRFGKYTGESIDVEVNGKLKATHFYGDGSNLTGVTVSNADTVDNLHATSFLRSDAADTGTGTITLADSSAANNPLILGSSSQTSYTLQQFQTSSHSTNNAYLIAYGANHGSQAGNFAVKNIISNGEIFFELASGVEPLRMTSTGATFAGKVRANSWFQGADGTNTLYSNATSGTLIQTPGSTANDNDSKIYFRNHGLTVKHTFDTNNGNAAFAGDIQVDGGDMTIVKQNGSPTINMLRDSNDPGTNTLLHYLNFQVDYGGSHQDWGGIEHRTTTSATRTKLNFNVKSTGGSVLNALSLDGTTNGTTATFAGSLDVGTFTLSGSGIIADAGMTLQTNSGGVNAITLTSAGAATFAGNITASSGTGHFSVVNASAYQLNGTYIVDSSRNLVNISSLRFGSSDAFIDTASTTSATATTVVASVAHATYNAAFFDFVIKNGTNVRAGTVYACHNGASTPLVEFAETSTVDLGDTSDVTLNVVISGANMILQATTTSSTWTIKSLVRTI